jgi:hypothetical protein
VTKTASPEAPERVVVSNREFWGTMRRLGIGAVNNMGLLIETGEEADQIMYRGVQTHLKEIVGLIEDRYGFKPKYRKE